MKKIIKLSLMFFLFYSITFGQIVIDGDMSDWTDAMKYDIPQRFDEGLNDSIDLDWDGVLDGIINPALDIENMFVTHDDDFIYVRLDINENGTFADLESMVDGGMQAALELFIDTDVSPATGLTWGWWATSGDYWINLSVKRGWPGFGVSADYGILKFTGANGSDSQWEEVEGASCSVAANLDDNKMEIAIPRAAIGETDGELESTGFIVLGEDPTAGWNADIVPNDLGGTASVYRYGKQQITIDGDMSDWTADTQFDIPSRFDEELNDSIDVDWDGVMDGIINPALDVENMFVTHDDNYIYVRLDINENGTFTDLESMVDGGFQAALELFIDTDVSPETGLTWGWWATSGDYWINLSVKRGWPGFELTADYGIMKFTGANGSDSQWEEVAGATCMVAANLDDNKVEIAIPRAAIGETNGDLETTGFIVLGEDPTAGWNADIVPNDLGGTPSIYRYGKTGIAIDGDMSDWTSLTKFDVTPNMEEGLLDSVDSDWDGIMDGIINPALDIKDVYVTHDDDYLYVRVDINEDGTFTDLESMVDAGYKAPIQLYFDTDLDSATGLTWGYWLNGGDFYVNITDADGNPGLEVTQPFGLLQFTGLNGNDESFVEVEGGGCTVAVNLDDNIIEVAVPRALIGETNGENESTGILVFSEDPTTDWVNDAAPSADGSFRNVYNYGNPLGPVTGIETEIGEIPTTFDLSQNYPNPFNPTTNIKFSLASRADVSLRIFNILGQQVATLLSNQDISAGVHTVEFNASELTSGMYIYVIEAGNFMSAKKMMLLK